MKNMIQKRKKLISWTPENEKCLFYDSVKRLKRQATDQEKVFANHISDEGFILRWYKLLSKVSILKI